jgi:hypothetical protein
MLKEFRAISPDGYIAVSRGDITAESAKKIKPITRANLRQFRLENAIYHFTEFAGYALIMPN